MANQKHIAMRLKNFDAHKGLAACPTTRGVRVLPLFREWPA